MGWVKRLSTRYKFAVAIVFGIIVGGAGLTIVQAAIPDTDGKIYACYTNNSSIFNAKGTLQVVDKATTPTCPSGTTAISWTQNASYSASGLMPVNAGDDMSVADITYRDFTGVNMTGNRMFGTDFTGSNLTDVNVTDAFMHSTSGFNVRLNNVDFRPTETFQSVQFHKSQLKNTNFSGMVLGDNSENLLEFRDSDFTGANFSNAVITGARLNGSTFSGANFTGATWDNVTCPDGTNSNNNGNTCIGHL